MNKRQEEIILKMSDLAEELSEYVQSGTFGVANGEFSVKFDCKYSDL